MSLESLNKVYVRLAFANLTPSIGTTGDYTKAGILDLVNAEWTAPAADPSWAALIVLGLNEVIDLFRPNGDNCLKTEL